MRAMLIGRMALAAVIAALAAEAGAVEWDVSLWGERRASTEHVHKLAELVEEATDGQFTLNIVYDELSKNTENLDGISLGAFEMAQFCAGYHADKNPTLTVLELPFLGVSTMEEEIAVSRAVYAHPAVRQDLARWKAMLLMPSPTPQYNLAGVGDPPDSLEAFRRKRVRAIGGPAQTFEAAGAVSTPITSSEAYAALESGVVDMVAFPPNAHLSFGTLDLAEWWLGNLNPGSVNCPIAVSIEAYEQLTPDHRRALNDAVDDAMEHYVESNAELLERWDDVLAEKGVQKVALSDAEILRFEKAAAPIKEQWVERMEAQGIPGRELLDLVHETLRQDEDTSN